MKKEKKRQQRSYQPKRPLLANPCTCHLDNERKGSAECSTRDSGERTTNLARLREEPESTDPIAQCVRLASPFSKHPCKP